VAREAARIGGTAPAILNAANEAAVAAFLDGKMGFTDIIPRVCGALEAVPVAEAGSLDVITEADGAARRYIEAIG
jgi:1-deoxy-D-xylulose-5-phosphate reductoisomerase